MDAEMDNESVEQPEEHMSVRDVMPEVALIALLLLLWGVKDATRIPSDIRELLHLSLGTPLVPIMLWGIIAGLLGTASIIAGIGLLNYAPWARRTALVVTLGYAVYYLVGPFIPALRRGESLQWVFQHPVFLFLAAQYAVMSYILNTPRIRVLWAEDGPPDQLTALALERAVQRTAVTLPPALLLIALLIFCRAGEGFALLLLYPREAQHLSIVTFLTHHYTVWVFIGYVVAGIALLCRAKWGQFLAILALAAACILRLAPYFQPEVLRRNIAAWGTAGMAGILLMLLLSLVTTVVLIAFLLRPEPRVTEHLFEGE